ncbi:DUF397 domain-containing protein [Nocardiopsis nanhaiensis]
MHPSIERYCSAFRSSSSSTAADDCVEVADGAAGAAMRGTRHRELSTLTYPNAEWQVFLWG